MASAGKQPSHSKAAKRKKQLARRFTPGILPGFPWRWKALLRRF